MREGTMPAGPPTPEYLPLDETSLIGRTALERKSRRIAASAFPPYTAMNGGRLGLQHMMAAPLLVGDRLVGTLTVARTTDAPITADEGQLIESCATHVAVILEHLRLYDDLKVSYDELAHTQS